ncbi:type II toxin-antitoxin system RelE/ParE family toxin [Rhizobium sp. SAFR-030]|uniref:type II toxin-antitoxin system RelE/ParE family toxin n=1 Tax=Rhizobium sp. SAFR-030 TaxID=3387277 RepID=UPI003F802F65
MNVKFTPQALADLESIHRYIGLTDERAADRILSRIRQITETLASFPLLGREGMVEETREFAVPGLSYTIVYRLASATELDVLTVVHQRKKYPPEDVET